MTRYDTVLSDLSDNTIRAIALGIARVITSGSDDEQIEVELHNFRNQLLNELQHRKVDRARLAADEAATLAQNHEDLI